MPEIIKEWVGYNGKMTEEKKPDGTTKKTKHNKIWAVALTDTGHVYVRYGLARHPLKLTEQIIRPKRGLSERDALGEAERIVQEKVQEKLNQKGYDAISFGTEPHYVPSFSQWRMSDEPEEVVAPVHDSVNAPDAEVMKTLEDMLISLSHALYTVDIGDRQTYLPATLLEKLHCTEEGRAWLSVPCLHRKNTLLHADTQELLATLVVIEGRPMASSTGMKKKE